MSSDFSTEFGVLTPAPGVRGVETHAPRDRDQASSRRRSRPGDPEGAPESASSEADESRHQLDDLA